MYEGLSPRDAALLVQFLYVELLSCMKDYHPDMQLSG